VACGGSRARRARSRLWLSLEERETISRGLGLRTSRRRAGKLADDPTLRRYVEEELRLRWSPQQISHRLIIDHPHDGSMGMSHETVYTSLFVQSQGRAASRGMDRPS
jgi:IS30 family transposase